MDCILFQYIVSTKQHIKLKAFFNSITMATLKILSHKTQNLLTAIDLTMAATVTTHIH